MSQKEMSEKEAQIHAERAATMWQRALVIAGNETKIKVALAVVSAHLAEYKNIPQEFLTGAVFNGLVAASSVENELKENGVENPQIMERARIAEALLKESGILRPEEGY